MLYPLQIQLDWLEAYTAHYLKPGQAKVLEARNGEDVIGKLPLQEEVKNAGRLHKIRRWIPLGSGPSDFYPLQMQPEKRELVAANWVEQLHQRYNEWDVLILDNIPESDPGLPLLQKALGRLGNVKRSVSNGFYSVNTAQPWEMYFESVVKPKNKDLLKDLRKLEREGINLKIERHRSNIFPMLQSLLDMYAQRRETLGQSNNYTDPARMNFVREVLASREPQNRVELSLLKDAAGSTWAFQLDWLWDGTRYHWNHAYNRDFKKYSPGKLLLYKIMEADFANPDMHSINHMRGMAGYKTTLADTSENLIMLKVDNARSFRLRKIALQKKVMALFQQMKNFQEPTRASL